MKKIRLVVATISFILLFVVSAFAGTGVIQFGDPTVTRDKVFNLTMKVKSTDVKLKTATVTFNYDPNILEFVSGTNAEGGAGTVKISGTGEGKGSGTRVLEYIIKFKALYAGTANVTIADQEVSDNTGNLVNITKLGTSKITIKPSSTKSKNANLGVLEFTPGEIDRPFEGSVLTYNTEVNADVEELAIKAVPEDKDAKVTVSGNSGFVTGMNKITIDVTASDGKTKKTYLINVTKLETGVTDGEVTITNGQRITSNKYTITIMIKPDDIPIPSGYKKLLGEDGGNNYEAYGAINDGETPETFLIYGMNKDGVVDFYRFDKRNGDNTIQRYVQDPNSGNYEEEHAKYESTKLKHNELAKKYNVVFPVACGLLGLVVILLIVLIIVIIRKNGNNRNPYENNDDFDDDDDGYFEAKKPVKIENDNLRVREEIEDDSNDSNDLNNEKNINTTINDIEELD